MPRSTNHVPRPAIADRKRRIVQVGVVKLLTNHQVGEEASLGGDEVSTPERDFEIVAEASVVGGPRTEIAGRRSKMEIPARVVQTCDVGADLRAREGLALLVVTIGRRRIDHSAALGRNADRIRGGRDVRLTADAARPNAAAGLIGRGIGGGRHEGTALLGEEGRADVADCRGNRRTRGAGRNCQRADIVDDVWSRNLRGGAVLERRGEGRRSLSERAG